MNKKKYIYFLVLWFTSTVVFGQLLFTVETAKKEVSLNEKIVLRYHIINKNGDVTGLTEPIVYPNFGVFQLLGEQYSNETEYVNGKMSNTVGVDKVLLATKKGVFNIPPAKIKINGRIYNTQSIQIKVSDKENTSNAGQKVQGAFIRTEISQSNPYLNQGVLATVKMYAKNAAFLEQVKNFKTPQFSGMSVTQIAVNDNEYKQESYEGEVYLTADLASFIIYPQMTGRQKIDVFSVLLETSDGFFSSDEVEISTEPIVFNVKALPVGQPQNYSGAVGSFNLSVKPSKKELKANESATVDVEISGNGNLAFITPPDITTSSTLEVYSPQKKQNFNATTQGVVGQVVKSFVIVPQYGDSAKINPVQFSYFDPELGVYKTISTKSIDLTVRGGIALGKSNSINDSLIERPDFIPNDNKNNGETATEFAKNNLKNIFTGNFRKVNFFESKAFLGLLAGGFIFMVLSLKGYFGRKRRTKEILGRIIPAVSKIVPQKLKNTTLSTQKEYIERLKKIENAANTNNNEVFFHETEILLHDLIVQKTNITHAELTLSTIQDKLIGGGFNAIEVQKIIYILEQAKMVKYTPNNSQENLFIINKEVKYLATILQK